MIQFGSNDKHMYEHPTADGNRALYGQRFEGKSLESPEVESDFKDQLKFYIDEARALGLKPVLISPVNPRYYATNGRLIDDRAPFPRYIKEEAETEGIPYLDLHQKSMEEYAEYECVDGGEVENKFGNCKVWHGENKPEITHLKQEGAEIVAGWIKELACQEDAELCSQFR